jgi:hypothetical protein
VLIIPSSWGSQLGGYLPALVADRMEGLAVTVGVPDVLRVGLGVLKRPTLRSPAILVCSMEVWPWQAPCSLEVTGSHQILILPLAGVA